MAGLEAVLELRQDFADAQQPVTLAGLLGVGRSFRIQQGNQLRHGRDVHADIAGGERGVLLGRVEDPVAGPAIVGIDQIEQRHRLAEALHEIDDVDA